MGMDNHKQLEQAIKEATEQSLAEWGFIDIKEDTDSCGDGDPADKIMIRLAIETPLAGEMFFAYSGAMARRIAENLFKGEMLVSPSILRDIMGESSNIIVGRCFQLFAPNEKMTFGLPEVQSAPPAELASYKRISFLTYEKEGVCVAYRLKG
jgi:hypothetical protein